MSQMHSLDYIIYQPHRFHPFEQNYILDDTTTPIFHQILTELTSLPPCVATNDQDAFYNKLLLLLKPCFMEMPSIQKSLLIVNCGVMIYHFSPTNNFYLIVFKEQFSKIFEPDPNLNTEDQMQTNAVLFKYHFSMAPIDQELKEQIRQYILLNPQVQTIMYSVNSELYHLIDKKYPNWKLSAMEQAKQKAIEYRKKAADELLQKTLAQNHPIDAFNIKPSPFKTSIYSPIKATPPPIIPSILSHIHIKTPVELRPGATKLNRYNGENISRYNIYTYNNELYRAGSDTPLKLQTGKGRPYYTVGNYNEGHKDYKNIYPDELFGIPAPLPPPEPSPDQYKQIMIYNRTDVSRYEVYIRSGEFYHKEPNGTMTPLHTSTINRSVMIDCNGFIFDPRLIRNNIPRYLSL
jgi:hypothetical protein